MGRKSLNNSLLVKTNRLPNETRRVVVENQTKIASLLRGIQHRRHEGEIRYFCAAEAPRFRLASINYAAVVRRRNGDAEACGRR